jgi:RNase H-like domain found in reverse transcriptase/Integrase zinc binding domain
MVLGSQARISIQGSQTGPDGSPVLGHPMAGQPYQVHSDASDIAIGTSLQQVQPIKLKDLLGSKAHDKVMFAYKAGGLVPQLARQASEQIHDVPEPGSWEDMVMFVEQVIAYWSHSLKKVERNYSATEREALSVKEALVCFQPFIEREQNIIITDHTVLQWAQTYENANHCLAAWGAVFGAYPGLEIVYQAGVVHSNIDLLSRLKRTPPHQLPVKDNMLSLPEQSPDQLLVNWQSQIDKILVEKVAFLITRSQKVQSPPHITGHPSRPVISQSTEEEMLRATIKRGQTSNPPSKDFQPAMLSVSISPTCLESFIKGYKEDPSFKNIWNSSNMDSMELKAAQQFYKSKSSLLIFRDADWVARLCIPCNKTLCLLQETHDSPWEAAHAGVARLFLKLNAQFYWPQMWLEVLHFTKTCDVCQKIKLDTQGPNGKLLPHSIPLLPYKVVSLDLITGLPKSDGFDAILVIVDKFSKYIHYLPTHSKLDQEGFTKLFTDEIIYRKGIPKKMGCPMV